MFFCFWGWKSPQGLYNRSNSWGWKLEEAKIYTPILSEGVPNNHLESSLVYMYAPSFSLENKLLVYTKPLFCLLRHLSFQSWKHLWCILFPSETWGMIMHYLAAQWTLLISQFRQHHLFSQFGPFFGASFGRNRRDGGFLRPGGGGGGGFLRRLF